MAGFAKINADNQLKRQRGEKHSVVNLRKKVLQYHQFFDARSIGLFIADQFSSKSYVSSITRYDYALRGHKRSTHDVSNGRFNYARLCGMKYQDVLNALHALDTVLSGYFMVANLRYKPFQQSKSKSKIEDRVKLGSASLFDFSNRLSSLESISQVSAIADELGMFYVMELERQGVLDMMDDDAHAKVLKRILSEEPLRTTFLSSSKNNYSACPFHAIGKVFSLDFNVEDDDQITLKDELKRGALLPFIMQRIEAATGLEPKLRHVPQLENVYDVSRMPGF